MDLKPSPLKKPHLKQVKRENIFQKIRFILISPIERTLEVVVFDLFR